MKKVASQTAKEFQKLFQSIEDNGQTEKSQTSGNKHW